MNREGRVERHPSPGDIARFWPVLQASLTPMMLADDERRYVDANVAACELLKRTREEIRRLRVDDLAAPELRDGVVRAWSEFLRTGWQAGVYRLRLPDSRQVEVEFAATANVAPGLHLSVLHVQRQVAESQSVLERLTPRERAVLGMVAMGADNAEVSERLMIGVETVRTHIQRILRKLEARNRAHAVAIAMRHGLINPEIPKTTVTGDLAKVPRKGDKGLKPPRR